MTKSTTADGKKIDDYLKKHSRWSDQLSQLREILCACAVDETVKWGAPAYTVNGKLIITMGAFKSHYVLWFHQGVFLKDNAGKLINAQEGVTKGLRQWRFEADDTVNPKLVTQYVNEAIDNQLAGKTIKPEPKPMNMPTEFAAALEVDNNLQLAFSNLSPGKQKEYAHYVSDAKQQKTRLSRIEKITPMILSGVGLNDRYRKN